MQSVGGTPLIQTELGLAPTDVRPDAGVLCYPVISAALSAGGSTFPNLLGEDWKRSGRVDLSLETSVTPTNPPAFLWTTWEDGSVPHGEHPGLRRRPAAAGGAL